MPRTAPAIVRARLAVGAVAALLGAVAVGGCGSEQEQSPTTTVVAAAPEPAAEPTAAEPTAVAEPARASEVDAAASARPPAAEKTLALNTPADAHPVIWVRAGHRVAMRTEAGGGELVKRIRRRTEFGSPSVFGVVARRGAWVGVTTALLANGKIGWIKLDPKRLKAGWTRYSIVVDLSDRSARLLSGEKSKGAFPVTIGAPGSTTPIGRFSVTDTFTDLNSAAYGCCALALSATQPNLPSGWLGGRRIAIHGTSGPLGAALSHGCVRAADGDVAKLIRRVPLGTPVLIQA